jgi:non-homologous end joining protein Ku
VLRDTIARMGRVALGRVVLTNREHVIALERRGKGMVGMLLRYPHEIRRSSPQNRCAIAGAAELRASNSAKVLTAVKARFAGSTQHFSEAAFRDAIRLVEENPLPRLKEIYDD